MYPLANDENGYPLDVPAQAAGWLIRRHGGGKGRPAAVYDGEGRPLVVPLESTATDLLAAGCGGGTYRLDAVDGNRRPLNVTAYTELTGMHEGGAAVDVKPVTPTDALLLAVARSMEAMQRVQAERERHHAEILKRAIDRLGVGGGGTGNGGITWKDLDDYDRRKTRAVEDEIARRNAAAPALSEVAADEDEEDEEEAENTWAPLIEKMGVPVVNRLLTVVDIWIASKWTKPTAQAPTTAPATATRVRNARVGASPASSATSTAPQAVETSPAEATTPDERGAASNSEDLPKLPPEIAAMFDAAFALLTPEEQALADEALPIIPSHLRDEVGRTIMLMSSEAAVEHLRRHVFPQVRRLLGKPEPE